MLGWGFAIIIFIKACMMKETAMFIAAGLFAIAGSVGLLVFKE